ncbi:MAG: YtxH domain-containing protein [Bacillota bacterium]
MRNGFWRGVIAGSLIGTALGMLVVPHLATETRDRLFQTSKRWKVEAGRAMKRGAREVAEAVDKL